MTQEEKSLLIKDICTRFPYGVKVHYTPTDYHYPIPEIWTIKGINDLHTIKIVSWSQVFDNAKIEDIKPYLRPISSMTEEEFQDFRKDTNFEASEAYEVRANGENKIVILQADCDLSLKELDWLLSKGFDIRGLIPMGLALEAPEDMYNN